MPTATQEAVNTTCTGKASPLSLCYYNLATTSYVERALVWKMNDTGQISAPVQYGFRPGYSRDL